MFFPSMLTVQHLFSLFFVFFTLRKICEFKIPANIKITFFGNVSIVNFTECKYLSNAIKTFYFCLIWTFNKNKIHIFDTIWSVQMYFQKYVLLLQWDETLISHFEIRVVSSTIAFAHNLKLSSSCVSFLPLYLFKKTFQTNTALKCPLPCDETLP